MNDFITIISLALTSTYLIYSCMILKLWWPEVVRTYQLSGFNTPEAHLARGIFAGFMASLLDNFFWGVTWLLVLFDHPYGLPLMLSGSLGNVFFRQIGGLYSAHEHLTAANSLSDRMLDIKLGAKLGWAAGLVVLLTLATFSVG